MSESLDSINLKLWCLRAGGHLSTLLFVIGFGLAMQFIPAPSPTLTAEQITAVYQENAQGIQIGATLMMLGFTFWIPWGIVLACWIRRVEKDEDPLLTYLWLASTVICEVVGVIIAFFWAVAAFRPGELSPEITMTLNDMAWLVFLIPWGPFSIWCATLSLAILRDRSANPVFPRWVAGLGFWVAFAFIPAMLPLFFKTGGFAYNGLLGMYLPVVVFWLWMEVVTNRMAVALQARRRQCLAAVAA
jgi:hypothetical protein